jgi:aryl-alcohol dehydrogenase-like predicted oxidoreductase
MDNRLIMRHVSFAPLSRSVSAIGFGCASLGSRIDARRGREALARAYDAGVSWFDVAPSYGDGQAEVLLGGFLVGKRLQVTLCTKVGILPSRVSLPMRVAKPTLQRAIAVLPGLRKHLVKFRPPAQRVELTGSFIESSLVESLRRLQTDYVDVLALHDARLEDVQREDVLRALDNVVRKGYARTISSAGDPATSLAAVELSKHINVIQVSNTPFHANLALAKQLLTCRRAIGFVIHSVYGQNDALAAMTSMIEKEDHKRNLLHAAGYRGATREVAAAFLLDFALASNRDGVVLLSMYQPRHLDFDLSRITSLPPADVVVDLAGRLIMPSA